MEPHMSKPKLTYADFANRVIKHAGLLDVNSQPVTEAMIRENVAKFGEIQIPGTHLYTKAELDENSKGT
jgi:hypothetical protein